MKIIEILHRVHFSRKFCSQCDRFVNLAQQSKDKAKFYAILGRSVNFIQKKVSKMSKNFFPKG